MGQPAVTSSLANTPVGNAGPSRSSALMNERRCTRPRHSAVALRPGTRSARRANSRQAGMVSHEGSNTSALSSLLSMKPWRSSSVVMPLASAAAMKPPADTPT